SAAQRVTQADASQTPSAQSESVWHSTHAGGWSAVERQKGRSSSHPAWSAGAQLAHSPASQRGKSARQSAAELHGRWLVTPVLVVPLLVVPLLVVPLLVVSAPPFALPRADAEILTASTHRVLWPAFEVRLRFAREHTPRNGADPSQLHDTHHGTAGINSVSTPQARQDRHLTIPMSKNSRWS